MIDKKLYSTNDVANKAGVSRDTILRWLRGGKIPEPDRDRNGWRIFTEQELKAILRYANKVTPALRRTQGELFRLRQRS